MMVTKPRRSPLELWSCIIHIISRGPDLGPHSPLLSFPGKHWVSLYCLGDTSTQGCPVVTVSWGCCLRIWGWSAELVKPGDA